MYRILGHEEDEDEVVELLWREYGRLPVVRYRGELDLTSHTLVSQSREGGHVRVQECLDPERGLYILECQVVLFDFETTHLDLDVAKIVQMAFFNLNTGRLACKKVNPGIPISDGSAQVHGITNDMVAKKPTAAEAFAQIFSPEQGIVPADYWVPVLFLAHNNYKFDMHLFARELGYGWPVAWYFGDTQRLMYRALLHNEERFQNVGNFKLTNLYTFFTDQTPDDAHKADADVRLIAGMLCAYFHCDIDVLEFRIRRLLTPAHPPSSLMRHRCSYFGVGNHMFYAITSAVFDGFSLRLIVKRHRWTVADDREMARRYPFEDAGGIFCMLIKTGEIEDEFIAQFVLPRENEDVVTAATQLSQLAARGNLDALATVASSSL